MNAKKSYEYCPNRKVGLEGIEDKIFRCEKTLSFSAGCEHRYYDECHFKGKFRMCRIFKHGPDTSSGYMGCSAGAIR